MSLIDEVEAAAMERDAAALAVHVPPVQKSRVVFNVKRGAFPLYDLRLDEVRELSDSGKMTEDELREWAAKHDLLNPTRPALRKKGEAARAAVRDAITDALKGDCR